MIQLSRFSFVTILSILINKSATIAIFCHSPYVTFVTSVKGDTLCQGCDTGRKEAIVSGNSSRGIKLLNFAHNCKQSLASGSAVKSFLPVFKKFSKNNAGCAACTFSQLFAFFSRTRSLIQKPGTLWLSGKLELMNYLRFHLVASGPHWNWPDFWWYHVTLLNCNGDYQISQSAAWSRYTWIMDGTVGTDGTLKRQVGTQGLMSGQWVQSTLW